MRIFGYTTLSTLSNVSSLVIFLSYSSNTFLTLRFFNSISNQIFMSKHAQTYIQSCFPTTLFFFNEKKNTAVLSKDFPLLYSLKNYPTRLVAVGY